MIIWINVFICNVKLYVEMELLEDMKNAMMEIFYHMMDAISVKYNVNMDVIFALNKCVKYVLMVMN